MFLIIKINAKVLTQLQTNTNQTRTTDEKTRELLCLLPQKNNRENKLPRPSDKEPPKINRIKRTQWLELPTNDLRYLYASSDKSNVYQLFKEQGLIYDLKSVRERTG